MSAARWMVFVLLATNPLIGIPQVPPGTSPADPRLSSETIDPAALGDFVDRAVSDYMHEHHIAGVTVAVVSRDGVLLERGYGVTAVNPLRAVDPSKSLFGMGSISKTFTVLAAMQAVSEGKIDLDADINRYLPANLRIPADEFPPIHVVDLLSHRAGFEDSVLGDTVFAPEATVPSLDDYLVRFRPKRVRPPGIRSVYGNYASGLLGAIVAHASGESYENYIDSHILTPLGMAHTTFREPLPDSDLRNLTGPLRGDFDSGFEFSNGAFAPAPLEHLAQSAPFDGGRTTAADMARYMRMLLGQGTLDGAQVLSESVFRTLVTIDARNVPDLEADAIAHGFWRKKYGRYESLEKNGSTIYFRANMVMLPDAGIGVFIATNTAGLSNNIADSLPTLIFQRFLPDARPVALPAIYISSTSDLQRFVGKYIDERRNYSTLEKLLGIIAIDFVNEAKVAASKDGKLTIGGQQATRIAPLTFMTAETGGSSGTLWHFFENQQGRVVAVSPGGASYYDRVGILDDPQTLSYSIRLTVLLSLCVLLVYGWPVIRRRESGTSVPARVTEIATLLGAVSWITFFVMFLLALGPLEDPVNAMAGIYPSVVLKAAITAAYVTAAITVLIIVSLPLAWRLDGWSTSRKVFHTVFALATLGTVLLLVQWRVLGAPLMLGS